MSSNNPLVSILVPVYGVERYIERCARSLFEQTYPLLEFIFVNDSSPDKSIHILQKVINEYPKLEENIKIIHHAKNRGLAATRNTLVANSNGKFILHVDSDDWLEPNAVELLVERQIETNADIVTASFYKQEINNGQETISTIATALKEKNREESLKTMLEFCSVVAIWNRLIRKSLYLENNIKCIDGIDAGEDLMTTPRLVYFSKKVTTCDAVTYHYNRINSNSYVSMFPQSWEMQSQLINATLQNVVFFKDKEACFREAINIQLVKRLKRILDLNFDNHYRHGYNSVLDILEDTERKYWVYIGWNNYRHRLVDRSYYVARLLSLRTIAFNKVHQRIRKTVYKFASSVKKMTNKMR